MKMGRHFDSRSAKKRVNMQGCCKLARFGGCLEDPEWVFADAARFNRLHQAGQGGSPG
jgi:hypothetical protein